MLQSRLQLGTRLLQSRLQLGTRLLQSCLQNLLLFTAPLALELLPLIGDMTRRRAQGTKSSQPFVLLWLMPIMHKRVLLLWLGIPLPKLTITEILWSIRPPLARTLTYPDMLKHSRDLTVKDSMKGYDKRLKNSNPRTNGHLFFAPRSNSTVAKLFLLHGSSVTNDFQMGPSEN